MCQINIYGLFKVENEPKLNIGRVSGAFGCGRVALGTFCCLFSVLSMLWAGTRHKRPCMCASTRAFAQRFCFGLFTFFQLWFFIRVLLWTPHETNSNPTSSNFLNIFLYFPTNLIKLRTNITIHKNMIRTLLKHAPKHDFLNLKQHQISLKT